MFAELDAFSCSPGVCVRVSRNDSSTLSLCVLRWGRWRPVLRMDFTLSSHQVDPCWRARSGLVPPLFPTGLYRKTHRTHTLSPDVETVGDFVRERPGFAVSETPLRSLSQSGPHRTAAQDVQKRGQTRPNYVAALRWCGLLSPLFRFVSLCSTGTFDEPRPNEVCLRRYTRQPVHIQMRLCSRTHNRSIRLQYAARFCCSPVIRFSARHFHCTGVAAVKSSRRLDESSRISYKTTFSQY